MSRVYALKFKIFCRVCNAEFMSKRSYSFYCSKKCSYEAGRETKKESDRKYTLKTKHIKTEYDRKRYLEKSVEIRAKTKQWRIDNPGKRWENEKKNLANNPQKYLYKRIQTLLKQYLKRRKIPVYSRTLEMLNFSIPELEQKLLSTLPYGYTWQDFLDGKLHIDHKKPHSLFTYVSPECDDFKECWSLDNLQLLTQHENVTKQNKYEH